MTTQTTTAPAYIVTTPVTFDLFFKWSTSKGRETYGYNIVTLRVDGDKVGRCMGGGYDMEGTALAQWMNATFPEQLRALAADRIAAAEAAGTARYYDGGNDAKVLVDGFNVYLDGLTVHKAEGENQPVSVRVDGGTGKSQMQQILKALGLQWRSIKTGRNSWDAATVTNC